MTTTTTVSRLSSWLHASSVARRTPADRPDACLCASDFGESFHYEKRDNVLHNVPICKLQNAQQNTLFIRQSITRLEMVLCLHASGKASDSFHFL